MEKNFETEVLTRLTKIETKLDDYNNMKIKTEDAFNLSKENEKEITELQEKMKWISRAVIGAVLTGIVGIVLFYLQRGLGIK